MDVKRLDFYEGMISCQVYEARFTRREIDLFKVDEYRIKQCFAA